MNALLDAIKLGNSEHVRQLLLDNPVLVSEKQRISTLSFEKSVEIDAFKFLGAYLGSMTALQVSILLGNDEIAKDIIQRSQNKDLNETFGGGNTALHLATFLGAREVVAVLLSRGANANILNSKGFSPLDVVDDQEMNLIYSSSKNTLGSNNSIENIS